MVFSSTSLLAKLNRYYSLDEHLQLEVKLDGSSKEADNSHELTAYCVVL